MAEWVTVAIAGISLVLSIVVPLIAHLYGVVHRNSRDLSDHKTHIAENYPTKIEVEKLGYRIERQMKDGFDNLKEILNNRREKDAA
jgi:hypothetical protein